MKQKKKGHRGRQDNCSTMSSNRHPSKKQALQILFGWKSSLTPKY